jgi:hypothetical protein
MDEQRQLRLDAEEIRDRLRPTEFVQRPTSVVGYVVGSPPTSVPAWFKIQPMKIGGKPLEGQDYARTPSGAEMLVYVVGPSVPALDDVLVARLVDGKWVADTCCGDDPCHLPATPAKIPQTDLALSWTGPVGSGSTTLKTTRGSSWSSDCFAFGGSYYKATILVYSDKVTRLSIAKYAASTCPGSPTNTYVLSPGTIVGGHDYGVRFTSAAGAPFEATWDVITDADGPCCAVFNTYACDTLISTGVTVYDDEDNVLASGTTDAIGRLPLMWTGTAAKVKADSTDARFADRIITYPDGLPCNSGVGLGLPPADPVNFQCCNCDKPVPKRLYLTTADGTYTSDYMVPQPNPNLNLGCVYTSVCYMKNLSPGVVMAKLSPTFCDPRNLGDPVDTSVWIRPRIVRYTGAGGITGPEGNGTYLYIDVVTPTYGATCVVFFTPQIKGPFYYAAVRDCNSVADCRRLCGSMFGAQIENPFSGGFGGYKKLVDCVVDVTVDCAAMTDGTNSIGPPIPNVVVSH